MRLLSTATRAISPIASRAARRWRAGRRRTPRRRAVKLGCGGGRAPARSTVPHASARDDHRQQVQPDGRAPPNATRRAERVEDALQSGPRHQSSDADPSRAARLSQPHASTRDPRMLRTEAHAATTSRRSRSSRSAIVRPRVALDREPARALAERRAARLVLEQPDDGLGERRGVAGRHEHAGAPPSSPSCTRRCPTRRPAPRTRTRASAPSEALLHRVDGATSAFAAQQLGRQLLLGEEAEDVDAVVRDPLPGEQQPTASGSAPTIRSRAPVRRRISGQARSSTGSPLRGSCRPMKTIVLLAAGRVGRGRDQHAVRDHLVLAGQPALRRLRAPAPRRRSGGRSGRQGNPRPASPSASSRGRRPRDRWRRAGTSRRRAPRRRSPASSARAGGARRSARARARPDPEVATRGLRTMFGSEPFAGTITVRPTGITSGGGSPWRPCRGCSARVNVPGGSLPMMIFVSMPRARERLGLQLCVLDARRPRRTTSTGRRCPPSSAGGQATSASLTRAECATRRFRRGRPRRAAHAPRRLGRLGHPLEPRARAGHRAAGEGLLGVRPAGHRLRPARRRRTSTRSTRSTTGRS